MLDIKNLVEVGKKFTIQKKVEEEDAALNYGSGMLNTVFATPSLVALMIEGAVNAIDKGLPEGFLSVGTKINVEHKEATVMGATVTIEGTISEFDGKKVICNFVAFDEIGEIGTGWHERLIVNQEAMLEKAHKRSIDIQNRNF